jgi:predicted RNA-binding Zn-ribbon protein involved in translation (DUF1610 family)
MNSQNEQQPEKKVYKNSQNSYEEISEKKTSKLGYILLIIMVIFVIIVGETIFSDLKRIPEKPISPSHCVLIPTTNLKDLTYLNCSNYWSSNEIDRKFELDAKFKRIEPQLQEISSLNKSIRSNEGEIRNLENNIQRLKKDYDLSLQEKMASEKAIMDKFEIKNQITNSRSQISSFRNKISSSEKLRNTIISQITSSVSSLKQIYDEAQNYYQTKKAWYGFKIFLLTLAFVLPFFALSVYFYLRLKRENSPYTIILAAITTAFSILFLQIIGVFLYDILPKEWFGRIFKFFWELPFLRYVIYYGSVIIVIGLFGGIVYYIQKKVFDPVKVAIRRLKDKKCPGCSFSLDSHHNFCPDCGLQLKEKCENCDNLKIRYLSHCPNCGKK